MKIREQAELVPNTLRPGQTLPVYAHTIGRKTDLIQVYGVNKISLENDDLSDETTTTDSQHEKVCHMDLPVTLPSTRPNQQKAEKSICEARNSVRP